MSYNKIILVGNCTKDGELKYTNGGSAIYNNSIATSRKFTSNGEKKEEVCFVDFTAFSRVGEVCNQYLRKGSKILVEGRLNFDQWTDQNGQKRSKHSIVVEIMQMLDSKGDNQSSGNTGQQQATQGYQAPQQQNYQAHTAYREPQRPMPDARSLPNIDIDIDSEIPF